MQQWAGNCARERWQKGGGEVQLMLGSKQGRGGIKEWMKLKVVRLRGVKREGDMMRARKEGQKRCLISRTPPSPFALSGGGSPNPHPHPTPQNTALWNFPRQAEGRRARVSAEEKQSGSDWEDAPRVRTSVNIQNGHGIGPLFWQDFTLGIPWSVVAAATASFLHITMPSVSLSLPTALAGPARTWVCLSCMFWVSSLFNWSSCSGAFQEFCLTCGQPGKANLKARKK